MENDFIVKEVECCYICNEYMGEFKNEFTVVTGYSEQAIFQLWESFTETELPQEIIDTSGVCQNCFIKFNEYDEHLNEAKKIKENLMNLFEMSNESASGAVVIVKEEDVIRNLMKTEDTIFVEEVEEYVVMEDDQIEKKSTKKGVAKKEAKVAVKKQKNNEKDVGLLISFMDGVKRYICDICGKTGITSRSRLRTHKQTHTDERNYLCSICSATFKTANCLKNHIRLHNNVFFHCDMCPSRFKSKHELRCHIDAKHLMKKDFTCQICGKAFSRDKTLRQHIVYHMNQRNVTCEICGFKTINQAKLQRHMKSHTGERNYECPICFKKFLYSYNVTSHIRHVHNQEKRPTTDETKLICQFCGKKFQKIWKVKEHISTVHAEEVQDENDLIEGIDEILDF